jgi:cysteinyl-tRNA synthetase
MIGRLIEQGNAYAADGHVLFSVATKADYGKLSNRSRDEMIAGARVEVAPYKRDPADFVLWKPSTADQPGWDSPWGRGRPGWHIECSAMSEAHLGESFDIHGGGLDLIFPHHENEIAQSESAHGGHPFARYWVHNGYVVVEGEKMSKSLGNFFTVRQLLEEGWDGEVIRLTLLKTHYRQPLDFTRAALQQSKTELDRLYNTLRVQAYQQPNLSRYPEQVSASLADDLNTPLAISVVHDMASELRTERDPVQQTRLKDSLLECGEMLGLLRRTPDEWFKGGDKDATAIEDLITRRNAARKARDFAEADRIRKELADKGIVLEDKPGGKTEWRRAG